MVPTNAIEMREPIRSADVLAGTFSYQDQSGNPVSRPFYVRTVSKQDEGLDASHRDSIRQNDLNQQLGDAFATLQDEGFTAIHYADARPNPFF